MDLLPMATEHQCRCGKHDGPEPMLDARAIPHAVRHGAVGVEYLQRGPQQWTLRLRRPV